MPKAAAEPHVALDHVAHVGDAVAELQGALDAHAEREAGVDVGVDAAGAQHVRVDHAAAAPLDPARAALLLREPHVHLGGRLGEGEVRRAQPGARLGAEHGAGERVERALEVRHRDADVHREALDLVRTPGCGWRPARRCGTCGPGTPRRRAARAPAAPAPAPARCGCAARAARRRTRILVAQVERVLHGAGGVVLLKFSASKLSHADSTSGPSATSQPIADEHVGDALGELRERVAGAARAPVPRQRDVDGLLDEHALVALLHQRRRGGRRTPPGPPGARRSRACPRRRAPGRAATRARGGRAAAGRGRRGARAWRRPARRGRPRPRRPARAAATAAASASGSSKVHDVRSHSLRVRDR